MIHVESALNILRLVRQETDIIGCALSFGKDSLATLDLCCRVFPRVPCYYLYRVANLDCVRAWADRVTKRYGVTILMLPHFDLSRCYRHAVLQPHWHGLEKTPKIDMKDIEQYFREKTGTRWIAYGWRRNDSFSRAMILKVTCGYDAKAHRVFPLRLWRRANVYEYLADHGIAPPPTLGRKDQGGLDFHPEALKFLSSEDRARWMTDFPFSGVQTVSAAVESTAPSSHGIKSDQFDAVPPVSSTKAHRRKARNTEQGERN